MPAQHLLERIDSRWESRSAGSRTAWHSDVRTEVIAPYRVGVLEDVSGQDADDRLARIDLAGATSLRTPARLAAEAGSQPMPTRSISRLGVHDLVVGDSGDHAAGR